MPIQEQIIELLKKINYPGFSRNIVSFGIVKEVLCEGDEITIKLAFTTEKEDRKEEIKQSIRQILQREDVAFTEIQQPVSTQVQAQKIPGVSRMVAVASGKGGVGKSTVAVNLACALERQKLKVGLLDADISGPSIPTMFGLFDRPRIGEAQKIIPHIKYGISLISLGFFLEGDSPVIWRGPMIHGAIRQMLYDVAWGELDYLMVDLPPGTGDAQLTLSQLVPLDGVVIVTTPQDVALLDAARGVMMFQKMDVPILGIIENMSYFECPHCHERTSIFREGGGKREAKKRKVPLLGEIPLDALVCEKGDEGLPIVLSHPESPVSKAFYRCAKSLVEELAL